MPYCPGVFDKRHSFFACSSVQMLVKLTLDAYSSNATKFLNCFHDCTIWKALAWIVVRKKLDHFVSSIRILCHAKHLFLWPSLIENNIVYSVWVVICKKSLSILTMRKYLNHLLNGIAFYQRDYTRMVILQSQFGQWNANNQIKKVISTQLFFTTNFFPLQWDGNLNVVFFNWIRLMIAKPNVNKRKFGMLS